MSIYHTQTALLMNQEVLRRPESELYSLSLGQLFPLLILFLSLASQLWIRVLIVERGYELEKIRAEALTRDSELRELHLTYATLTRPSFVGEQAQSRLAMVPLLPQHVRKLSFLED